MKEKMKKYRIYFILFALILIFAVVFTAAIYAWDEDIGKNPINGTNSSRSQIIMTGSGYTLSDNQEEEYKKEQETYAKKIKDELKDPDSIQSRIKAAVARAEEISKSDNNLNDGQSADGNESDINVDNSNSSEVGDDLVSDETEESQGDIEDDTGDSTEDTPDDIQDSLLPVITTSLEEGQHVSGNALTFTVKAVSYKNVTLDSFDIKVYLNGQRLYSSGINSHGQISYRTDGMLVDGTNEISITATDSEGNSSNIIKNIDVDINGARPIEGTVHIRLDAQSIGLGTLYASTEEIYQGESTAAFVDRVLKNAGFGIDHGGTTAYGYYLKRIYRTGITGGWTINQNVKNHLDEINASESVKPSLNSLGEHDIYDASGWMYSWNGEWPDGMSSITLRDGDELRIVFSLYYGYEYNGIWSDCRL